MKQEIVQRYREPVGFVSKPESVAFGLIEKSQTLLTADDIGRLAGWESAREQWDRDTIITRARQSSVLEGQGGHILTVYGYGYTYYPALPEDGIIWPLNFRVPQRWMYESQTAGLGELFDGLRFARVQPDMKRAIAPIDSTHYQYLLLLGKAASEGRGVSVREGMTRMGVSRGYLATIESRLEDQLGLVTDNQWGIYHPHVYYNGKRDTGTSYLVPLDSAR